MPTRTQLLSRIRRAHTYEEIAEEFEIPPGQAYMIATGVPADGSDVLTTGQQAGRQDLLEGSTQQLVNPRTEMPEHRAAVEEWMRARVAADEAIRRAGEMRTATPPEIRGEGETDDVVSVTGWQHKQVKWLQEQLETIPGVKKGGDEYKQQQRVSILDMIRVRLSGHETAEEEYFWPAVREHLDHGDELAEQALPTHYEPQESPVDNPMYKQQRSPVRQVFEHEHNRYHPSGREPGSEVYPHVLTTFRLTEHFTAGGMARWVSRLSELQPEMFCEVSPDLAEECGLEHQGWATIISARNCIEARVLVTPRMTPLVIDGRVVHQVAVPFHWGTNGYTSGDAANDLTSIVLDPNVHIQEVNALTVAIRPGRRPTGPARAELVREYQRRAGVTEATGTEVLSV